MSARRSDIGSLGAFYSGWMVSLREMPSIHQGERFKMESDSLVGQIILTVLAAILSLVVPILSVYLKNLVEQKISQAKASTSHEKYLMARGIVADLVRSAKARGLNGDLENQGKVLREYVIDRSQMLFDQYKLPFDANTILDLLESAYIDMVTPMVEVIEDELDDARLEG